MTNTQDNNELIKLVFTITFLVLIALVLIILCIIISDIFVGKEINTEIIQILTNNYYISFVR